MQTFPVFTAESAPEKSKASLKSLQQVLGIIPNIAGAMATSPVLIDCLVGMFQKVHGGSFSEAQIQTVLLTNAVTNRSEWPVAFHSALALEQGLDPADVDAMRAGKSPKDAELAPLSTLARTLIEKRGRLDEDDIQGFVAAGFSTELLLEVIAIVAASTITNYTGSVAKPPLEHAFSAHAWRA